MVRQNIIKVVSLSSFIFFGFLGSINHSQAITIGGKASSCVNVSVCNGGTLWECNPTWKNCPSNHSYINCDDHSTCITPYEGSVAASCYHNEKVCTDTRWCKYASSVKTWDPNCTKGIQYADTYNYTVVHGTHTCEDIVNWRLCDGSCGTRVGVYPFSTTLWDASETFCSIGTPVPASPTFPTAGTVTPWNCNGYGTGSVPAACSAQRLENNPVVNITATPAVGNLDTGSANVTLNWSVTNSSTSCVKGCTCTASNGWSGVKASFGSQIISVNGDTNFTLTCTNSDGGSGTDTVFFNASCTAGDVPPWSECSTNCGPGIRTITTRNVNCVYGTRSEDCNLGDCPISSEIREVLPE